MSFSTHPITYCSQLISFVKFLFWSQKTDLTVTGKDCFLLEINKWKQAYGGSAKCHQETKAIKKVSIEDCMAFNRSSVCQSSLKFLRNLKKKQPIVDKIHYAQVRNVLLLLLTLNNANRQGALYNMTEEEFDAAKTGKVVNGRICDYVIYVKYHKTRKSYACAKIVIDKVTRELVSNYKSYYRPSPIITKSDKKLKLGTPLFVTIEGNRMDSGGVHYGVKAVWKKAGLTSDISHTLIRKTVASEVHRNNSPEKGSLAEHMLHSVTTAAKSYVIEAQPEQCSRTSRMIRKIFLGEQNEEHFDEDFDEETSPVSPVRPASQQESHLRRVTAHSLNSSEQHRRSASQEESHLNLNRRMSAHVARQNKLPSPEKKKKRQMCLRHTRKRSRQTHFSYSY